MKNKTIANAGWIIGCKIIKAVLTFIVIMITARYLGPNNYGLINYAAGIVAFVTPITKLGLDFTIVHELINNKKKEGTILGTTIILCLISSILCIIGIVLFTLIANPGEIDTLIVCVLYSLLLIFQAVEMVQYWFQAKLLSKYPAIIMLASYIIITLFQVYLLITNKNIYWFAVSHSLDFSIIAAALIVAYKKLSNQKLCFSKDIAKKLLSKSKYYIISGIMVTVFAQTDKIMLKLMVGNEAVGLYAAAVTCANMANFIFAAIIDSAKPSIFENRKTNMERYKKNLAGLYSVVIYLSLLISLTETVFATIIINIMYGNQYSASVLTLRIVVWYTTFSYLGTASNIWMIAENKQKYLIRINLSGATLNIILNSLLIPKYGINGAAIASLITQMFSNLLIGFAIPQIRENSLTILKSFNPMQLKYILRRLKKGQRT